VGEKREERRRTADRDSSLWGDGRVGSDRRVQESGCVCVCVCVCGGKDKRARGGVNICGPSRLQSSFMTEGMKNRREKKGIEGILNIYF